MTLFTGSGEWQLINSGYKMVGIKIEMNQMANFDTRLYFVLSDSKAINKNRRNFLRS